MAKAPRKFDIRGRLGYRIQILSNKMILWSGRVYVREFNVGVQEWRVLAVLANSGEGTAKQICDFTVMDKGNVSRAVKKLVKAGRIEERPDTLDKRSTVLELTAKGFDLYHRIKKISDAREKRFMAQLSASERKALPQILTNLEGVMEDLLLEPERH